MRPGRRTGKRQMTSTATIVGTIEGAAHRSTSVAAGFSPSAAGRSGTNRPRSSVRRGMGSRSWCIAVVVAVAACGSAEDGGGELDRIEQGLGQDVGHGSLRTGEIGGSDDGTVPPESTESAASPSVTAATTEPPPEATTAGRWEVTVLPGTTSDSVRLAILQVNVGDGVETFDSDEWRLERWDGSVWQLAAWLGWDSNVDKVDRACPPEEPVCRENAMAEGRWLSSGETGDLREFDLFPVPAGQYRVRAWRPPDGVMTDATPVSPVFTLG